MDSALNTIADYLVLQTSQIPVIFALVLAGTWLLRSASSHWRYLLWLVVIAKCLTPPLLNLPLAVLPQDAVSKQPANVNIASTSTIGTEIEAAMAKLQSVASPSESLPQIQMAPTTTLSNGRASIPGVANKFSLRRWMVTVWILGVGVILTYVSGKVWATRRRLRQTRVLADEEIQTTVAGLAEKIGMRTTPTVYTAANVAQPFVWGWLRGDVYLPSEFTHGGSAEQRRAVLSHELAHVARWDAAVNLVQVIVQTVFFFHPLIWWANRKIRQEREKCCDEIVLSGADTLPQVYCEAIVAMLARESLASRSTPALAVTGSPKNIEERIITILTPDRKFYRRPSRAALLTLCFVAVCILPTAFVLTTQAARQDKPDAKSKPARRETTENATAPSTWQPGQVMDFRVINAETQKAMADVSLELQNRGPGIDFQDVKVQTTDANGRSQIKLPDLPPTAVRVYPSKPGFIPLRVYWEGEPHPVMPKSITIPMERGSLFGGIIRDETGKPIPNVAVSFDYWGPGAGENPHVRANVNAKTTSDRDGRWHVNNMPTNVDESRLRIYLKHADYVSDHLRRGFSPIPVTERPPLEKLFDQTAVLIMRVGETITGRVTDEDGQPIAGAKIHNSEYYNPNKPRAQTDPDGNFRISGVRPELLNPRANRRQWDRLGYKLYLTVQAPGYAPELVGVDGLSSPIEVLLKPGKIVTGRVIDVDGKPVEGVSIYARSWREQRNRLRLNTSTDADGRFRLADFPIDEVQYDVRKIGYMAVENFPMLASSGEYALTLKAPLRVVGSVVDAQTGKPLDKFTLIRGGDYEDGRAPWWQRYSAKTITNGLYETIFEQETFAYRVRVEADGYMPAESRIFRPYNPDQGKVTYDFKLSKAPPITGTVLDVDGQPLANADVYRARQRLNLRDRKVSSVEQMDRPPVKTDASGRFQFPAEIEPFCLVVVHEQGVGMMTEEQFKESQQISIEPWTEENQRMQIIRRPTSTQSVDFPNKYP